MAAKPDCDDGWLPYAHELDAALAVADFTKGARIVLREVFSQIFGLARRKYAELSPTEIGGRVGMARSHVMRGITELVGSGVLIRRPDGLYKFIKDYESWTYKGARRLSEAEVIYCNSAPRIAKSYIHIPTQNPLPNEVTHQQSPVTSLGNNGEDPLPNEVTDVTQLGNGLLPNEVTGSLPPPDPPCETRARNLRIRELRGGENSPPPPSGEGTIPFSDPIEDKPTKRPTNFAPDLGTASALVSGPGKDSQEAIDLEVWAVQFGTDTNRESYAVWARSACNYVPATWVRALLRNKVEGRSDRKGLAYLNSVLGAWMNEGRCKFLTDSGQLSQARPAPPTEYHTAPANSRHRIKRDH